MKKKLTLLITLFVFGGWSMNAQVMVKDINPSGSFSVYSTNYNLVSPSFTNVNGTVYFIAHNGTNGSELWKSNGTLPSTVMVKDIYPNTSIYVYPSYLTNVNGTLYFSANDGVNGTELWKSDGTPAGTVMVKNIYSGAVSFSSNPSNLTNLNGTLYFSASDGTNGTELWKSDGTDTGTVMLKDIYPGKIGSNAGKTGFITINGTLYFQATDDTYGTELWKSDGTTAGTVMVKDINAGWTSNPAAFTNINDTLYFTAEDDAHGIEVWKSDGTDAGTVMVKDINPGPGTSSPSFFTNANGTIYFSANDGTNGTELWKSDGTDAGTVLVKNIYPGSGSSISSTSSFTSINNTVYFSASDSTNGIELWKSDGTAAGTVMLKDIYPGKSSNSSGGPYYSNSSSPSSLINVNGTIYFSATVSTYGGELWKSDGTAVGTVLVKDIYPGSYGSSPSYLTNINGTLYFSANDGTNGVELWKYVVSSCNLAAPIITASRAVTFCQGDSVTLTSGTATSYSWNTGASTQSITVKAGGNYTVTIKDAGNCSATSAATKITVNTPPSTPVITLNGSALTSSATTGNQWYLGGNIVTGALSQSYTPTQNGNYTVTVTAAGCSPATSAAFNYTGGSNCNISVKTTTNPAKCGNTSGSAIAIASGGVAPYTYSWSNGTTDTLAANLGYGTYTVIAKDFNGCTQSTDVVISDNAGFIVSVDNVKNVTCHDSADGSINISTKGGTGSFSYSWSNGSITKDISDLKVGKYNVTVLDDSSNCRIVKSIILTEPSAISLTTTAVNASCGSLNGSATISVDGGKAPYTYSWNTIPAQTTQTVSNLIAKNYTVTVTDASGCFAKQVASVSNNGAPVVAITSKNSSCNGASDGSINVTVTGGSPPYSQSWMGNGLLKINDPGAIKSFPGLGAGSFVYQVTDQNGCSASGNIKLTQPEVLNLAVASSDVNCDLSNGRATVKVSGGVSPYTYTWNNNNTSANVSGLAKGVYTVTVKDANGCAVTRIANVGRRAGTQSLCLVTVDETTGKNVLVWEKTPGLKTQEYNIYREGSKAGVFEKIGIVPYDSLSIFVDSTSNPKVRAIRYKISTVDSCNDESAITTAVHSKTLHLTASYGVNKTINLIWENYEGFPFGTYRIWRGTNAKDMSVLDSVPSNIYTYTDVKPPLKSGNLFYSLEVVHAATCAATYKTGNNYNSAKSNTASISNPGSLDTTTSIVEDIANNVLTVYPNPNQGMFTLSLPINGKQNVSIRVFSMQGQLVVFQQISDFPGGTLIKEVDLSSYSKGIYHIQVSTDKGMFNQKVGVQ